MARVLITSGPTRQYLDPVRYLTNASSGRMGRALAEAAIAAAEARVPVLYYAFDLLHLDGVDLREYALANLRETLRSKAGQEARLSRHLGAAYLAASYQLLKQDSVANELLFALSRRVQDRLLAAMDEAGVAGAAIVQASTCYGFDNRYVADAAIPLGDLENPSEFIARHIGISAQDETHMLGVIGEASRRALIESIVPRSIARSQGMQLPASVTEAAALEQLKGIARKNKLFKSFIGQGYHGTHTPGVILRNILENPAWYTAYTPYQAEISQGRMEALVNFQTMVCDLTGMPIANASMLDEATAAAEAMTLAKRSVKAKGNTFIVSGDVHPQTLEVIETRAAPLGITVKVIRSSDEWQSAIAQDDYFAALNQYPGSSGWLADWQVSADLIHSKQGAFILAADLMALVVLKTPGEMGADVVVGSTQMPFWM